MTYQAGETAPLPNVLMATPDMDFNSTVLTVDILDTQPSTTIPLPVIDVREYSANYCDGL